MCNNIYGLDVAVLHSCNLIVVCLLIDLRWIKEAAMLQVRVNWCFLEEADVRV